MKRLPLFDTLRGVAMILMAIYHFCFDLNNFGVLHENMNQSEFWLDFRAVIMTLFMGLIGVGLYLGNADYAKKSYWVRLARIGSCAALISVVTYYMFGVTWVFFGVLHFAVAVSLFGPLLIRVPWLSLPVGLFLVVLPLEYRNLWWHRPGYIISGLSPWKPMTEDFAPLCPWLGVALLRIFVAFVTRRWLARFAQGEIRLLSRLGHHSLAFYMIHQVFLFPLAWLVSKMVS
jgi:uncharacterized membrane protein